MRVYSPTPITFRNIEVIPKPINEASAIPLGDLNTVDFSKGHLGGLICYYRNIEPSRAKVSYYPHSRVGMIRYRASETDRRLTTVYFFVEIHPDTNKGTIHACGRPFWLNFLDNNITILDALVHRDLHRFGNGKRKGHIPLITRILGIKWDRFWIDTFNKIILLNKCRRAMIQVMDTIGVDVVHTIYQAMNIEEAHVASLVKDLRRKNKIKRSRFDSSKQK